MFSTKGLEQNETKNHIVYSKTVSKKETVSCNTTKTQQPKEKNSYSLIIKEDTAIFSTYFSQYKSKIFDSKLFSRPPPTSA